MAADRQAEFSCPKCGSMFRCGDVCNKCGTHAPVRPEFYEDVFEDFNEGKTLSGRLWSNKLRRYLTIKEIKSGMRGG